MAIKDLSDKAKEIMCARKELEVLTNEQLTLRSLASLVSHNLPDATYYQVMASVLRERAEEKQITVILKLLSRLSGEEMEMIREKWF